jgi:hypothetical protein
LSVWGRGWSINHTPRPIQPQTSFHGENDIVYIECVWVVRGVGECVCVWMSVWVRELQMYVLRSACARGCVRQLRVSYECVCVSKGWTRSSTSHYV